FSEESSKEVADYLKKRDVEIKLNQRVMGYENYQLALNDGTAIDTKNVFWVAGVKANSLQGLPADAYGPGNRLKVDTYNRLSQYPNIFAIGDTALMISEEYPKGHPQVVQPAIQQARNLIRNLQRAETGLPLQPFIYQNKGSMATIGRNHAVVELKKLRFGGFPAWAVWLFIHLMSIVGVKNRLFIFVDWMWSYFTYDPSLRIIIKPLKRE
ncbi:NAD(P)/FAD-dependent oxidoreductase, partial [Bacteroides uniformis]